MQLDIQWVKTHKTSNHCVVTNKIKFLYSLPYVSLSDQHTSVMNTLRQTKLKYLSLKTPLQEIFDSQTQHVIELHSGLIEHANSYETTQKSITFEQPSLIFLLQCKKFSRSLSDLRQSELHTPYLTFVTKPIVSNNFQFLIQTLFLERTPWSCVGFTTHVLRHLAEEKLAIKRKKMGGRKAFNHV